jgi:hypothetical protein
MQTSVTLLSGNTTRQKPPSEAEAMSDLWCLTIANSPELATNKARPRNVSLLKHSHTLLTHGIPSSFLGGPPFCKELNLCYGFGGSD